VRNSALEGKHKGDRFAMDRQETDLPGVLMLQPRVFEDERGYFFESYRREWMESFGVQAEFVQDNQSFSRRGTLRGLHYQCSRPQAKLCRVVHGTILDVTVDLRRGSSTFGQWVSVELSAENKRQLFVPRGLAHGFVVLSESAVLLYKCDDYYDREDERGIRWNDPDLAIDWRVENPILSEKDHGLPRLADIPESDLPRVA